MDQASAPSGLQQVGQELDEFESEEHDECDGITSQNQGIQTDPMSKTRKLLYLFSGPQREDSIGHYIKQLGWNCENVDIEYVPSTDLLCSDTWDALLARICANEFDAGYASPPCGTFSAARQGAASDGGPRQLRGHTLPDLNGYAWLTECEKHEVKAGNVLADRAAEAMKWFADRSLPWGVEQPARRDGKPSMFNLEKFQQLSRYSDVSFTKFHQCRFGAKFSKATEILGNLDLSEWPKECNHPSQTWVIPWSGKTFEGPHPPLKGRQMAIPIKDWDCTMLGRREPFGPFLTKATAHYPSKLNRSIAAAIAVTKRTGVKRKHSEVPHDAVRNFSDLPTPRMKVGRKFPTNESIVCVGGLRNPYKSFTLTPKHIFLGVQIRNLIDRFCNDHPGFRNKYLDSIGHAEASHFPGSALIDDLRLQVSDMLLRNCDSSELLSADVNKSPSNTCLKANFLRLWLRAAKDPAEHLTLWLERGAPGGIVIHPDLDGIFERVDEDDSELVSSDALMTDFDSFKNYQGVEENQEAAKALQGYIERGFLTSFDTLEDCVRYLGNKKPILSKLGCVIKTKTNELGQEITKTRIILDAKQSHVTRATKKLYKSELPRMSDAVYDALALMSTACPGEVVTQLVADIVDAFWLIPLNPEEQKFFVAKFQNKYLVFNRTAQGSRTAPLTFAAIMATAGRLLQSLLLRNHLGQKVWQDGRLEIYVDDPWACFKGTQEEIRDLTSCLLIGWELLGFPIAYHKACLGNKLKWIGMELHVTSDCVEVHIPGEKMQEIKQLALRFLKGNVVADKDLRSFIGKCMSIASILHVWKPFIKQFYAALCSVKPIGTPQHCTWTSQIKTGLLWVLAFLDQESDVKVTKRVWHICEYLHQGQRITITWDSSPWGFGAVLYKDQVPFEYIVGQPTPFEQEYFDLEKGSSTSQQFLECLGGLVALREWAPVWRNKTAQLAIRNDNVGALVLLGQLETKSPKNSVLAREAALDVGMSSYRPQIVEHIPGITNVTCDNLSRMFQPGYDPDTFPLILRNVPRKTISTREKSWWRSLNPPCLRH
jgi:hypothetical protein